MHHFITSRPLSFIFKEGWKWPIAWMIVFAAGLATHVEAGDGPAVFTQQPKDQIVVIGTSAAFTLSVDGSEPLVVQWFRNGVPVGGATNTVLTLPSVGTNDHLRVFHATVSNAQAVAISSTAFLRVEPGVVMTVTNRVFEMTNLWRYNESGVKPGATWTATNYNDTSWSEGRALLCVKNVNLSAPENTALTIGRTTYYFRTSFNVTNPVTSGASAKLRIGALLDDGAVFYLNGRELIRPGMAAGVVAYGTFANRTVGDAAYEQFEVTVTNLVAGTNVFAAEVHQVTSVSSDVVFGAALDVIFPTRVLDTQEPAVEYLVPPASVTVRDLREVEVFFNESVTGVNAEDLLVHNVPANSVTTLSPSRYLFAFTPPPTGVVELAWAPGHGITDFAGFPHPLVATGWTYTLNPEAPTAFGGLTNLALFSGAVASDAMDGRFEGPMAIDGNLTTSWNVWDWHVPASREFVRLDLSFWRAFRFTTINMHWIFRPDHRVYRLYGKVGSSWVQVNASEVYSEVGGNKLSRWFLPTPQLWSGFRLEVPNYLTNGLGVVTRFGGVVVKELELIGEFGSTGQEIVLPSPAPLAAGMALHNPTLVTKNNLLEVTPVGGPRAVSRIEVDWSQAPRRSLLELTTDTDQILVARVDRYCTVYDLPQTYRLKLIRIVPLQSVGSSSAADRVRFLAPGTAANGPRLSKWVDTPLLKYERSNTGQLNNSPFFGQHKLPCKLLRGESESLQLVVRNPSSTIPVRGANVLVSDLTNSLGQIFSRSNVAWHPVGWVNHRDLEVLLPPKPFEVPPSSTRAVWFTIYASPEQPPGLYRGTATVTQPAQVNDVWPIEVEVVPLTLPPKTTVESTYFSLYGFEKHFGAQLNDPAQHEAIALDVAHNYARHRLFAGLHPLGSGAVEQEAEQGDFRRFDAWINFWKTNGLKPEIAIDSFPTPAPTWRLEFWNRVLQERGLDGAVKVGDEPGCTAPSGIYASEEAARVLKVAPYLRAKCAFSAMPLTGSQCGYLGNIREWGYGARSYSGTPMEEMTSFNAQRVAAGEKVFWYIHNFLQLDRPAYAHRMFFWTLLRYQVPGAMLFSTCAWDSAGVQECLGDYIIVSSSTEGTLLWPGDRQFLSGTRWEIIRDGIEDCDLNQLLKTRIDTFEAEYPGDALIANYRALLLDTDGVFRTFRENESLPSGYDINLHFGGSPRWGATNNPSNIILARDRRINALLALDTAVTTRWRTNHFNPAQLANPAISADNADPDWDGQSNAQERTAGTHPLDPESYLRLEASAVPGGPAALHFKTIANKSYTVQFRATSDAGPWQNLTNLAPRRTNGSVRILDPYPATPQRLYRLVTPVLLDFGVTNPILLAAPQSTAAPLGGQAQFTVLASGQPPLHYQWEHNGTSLPGATTSTLSLSNLQPTDAGAYAVRVTDVLGSTTSPPAILVVQP